MIPTVEEILRMLLQGQCSQEEALAWIDQHMLVAGNEGGLRDHFAGLAMQGDISSMQSHRDPAIAGAYIAERAYVIADAMLKARSA